MSCGIYKITNLINDKSYIGQSIHIEERWRKHRNYPSEYSEYPLYRAFRKYGLENFSFEILEYCQENELNEKEKYYISLYQTFGQGYNQTEGGEGASGFPIKLSLQDIQEIYDLLLNSNISQRKIAQEFSVGEDTISEINWGKTRTLEGFIFPLRQNYHKYYCQRCGKELKKQATHCIECHAFLQRKADRPNRKELKDLIRKLPFTDIGRKFGVSDNAIRKWCKAYNLPTSKREIVKYSISEWEKV